MRHPYTSFGFSHASSVVGGTGVVRVAELVDSEGTPTEIVVVESAGSVIMNSVVVADVLLVLFVGVVVAVAVAAAVRATVSDTEVAVFVPVPVPVSVRDVAVDIVVPVLAVLVFVSVVLETEVSVAVVKDVPVAVVPEVPVADVAVSVVPDAIDVAVAVDTEVSVPVMEVTDVAVFVSVVLLADTVDADVAVVDDVQCPQVARQYRRASSCAAFSALQMLSSASHSAHWRPPESSITATLLSSHRPS